LIEEGKAMLLQGSWKKHGDGFVLSLALAQKCGIPSAGRVALITKKDGSVSIMSLIEKIGEGVSNGVEYGYFVGVKAQG